MNEKGINSNSENKEGTINKFTQLRCNQEFTNQLTIIYVSVLVPLKRRAFTVLLLATSSMELTDAFNIGIDNNSLERKRS